ncbi:TRAP transporter fused permease subunit [Nonomuraea sp. MCN248]|uniref:TRAP transporter fused permease subunit n=1 Tax=Nonomuraea corallina TaxID=2989783 RepID=A0ABT4SHD6_9ACTN|nr:TRAP transporter fused permease subunit [Nonomuraea corallina]MDA0636390.1 TRAP transporter fused permease subunit [Nonomuraea corallina]
MTELSDREAALVAAGEQERPARRLAGPLRAGVWMIGGLLSAYSIAVVFWPVEALQHRMTFLAVALPLVFLCYRSGLGPPLRRLLSRLTRPDGPPAGAEAHPDAKALALGDAPTLEVSAPSVLPDAPTLREFPAHKGANADTVVIGDPPGPAGAPTVEMTPEAQPAGVQVAGEAGGAAAEGGGAVGVDEAGRAKGEWPTVADWLLALASLAVLLYPLADIEAFRDRGSGAALSELDVIAGLGLTLLLLEAVRRTVGSVLSIICAIFLLYAYFGSYLPIDWTIGHRGFDLDQIVSQLYTGTEGFFGVPLQVAATYIILFTIYGAVLDFSGASKFFIDLSFAAFRKSRSAPGRTVTTAGFLLGTVSGSGVATTVSLGSVAWPVLRRAGYPREPAGGILAAGGIGAILSPPTLGAAAFIIAEVMRVSYLQVLIYATVPTILYYLGIFLAIEIDSRRFRTQAVRVDAPGIGRLLLRFGYHFSSLVLIVVLMALDRSAFQAVVIATVIAFALSFLDPAHRMGPKRVGQALAKGTLEVLPVTAVCAAAGIIVGVITQTGLGLNLSSIIVDLAAGNLILTTVLAALAVMLLGLAVPVTASFIIAAVIIAPALMALGVAQAEAYMFIFYYAVLSEVSPPTALSAVAAAAITGGNTYRTMMMTWRYTLPAFLVPFAFVLTPNGQALLGQGPFGLVLLMTAVSAVAVAALAVATGGLAGTPERLLAAVAAVLLLFLEPVPIVAGLSVLAVAAVVHLIRRRSVPA